MHRKLFLKCDSIFRGNGNVQLIRIPRKIQFSSNGHIIVTRINRQRRGKTNYSSIVYYKLPHTAGSVRVCYVSDNVKDRAEVIQIADTCIVPKWVEREIGGWLVNWC